MFIFTNVCVSPGQRFQSSFVRVCTIGSCGRDKRVSTARIQRDQDLALFTVQTANGHTHRRGRLHITGWVRLGSKKDFITSSMSKYSK